MNHKSTMNVNKDNQSGKKKRGSDNGSKKHTKATKIKQFKKWPQRLQALPSVQ